MTWDGKEVKSVINPGPDSGAGIVSVDVVNWTVRIEGDIKDQAGKAVHVVAEGKLEDLGELPSHHLRAPGARVRLTETLSSPEISRESMKPIPQYDRSLSVAASEAAEPRASASGPKPRALLLALSLGVLLISSSVSAQRAPSAAYDGDRKVKLAGIVTSIAWVNPERLFFFS